MANKVLTITDIVREAVAVLHEKSSLAKIATRKFEARFGKKGGSSRPSGKTISVPKPPKYAVGTTADITSLNADSIEDSVDISVTTRRNTKMSFLTADLTMDIDDFSKQFIRPAISRLVREVDLVGFELLKVSPQYRYGRTVTTAISFSDYVQMNAIMTSQLCPEERRNLFASAIDHAVVVDANKGLFQSSEEIADQYANGYMGTSGGFEWVSTENTPTIVWASAIPVAGTLTATPAEGASVIAVTGMGANAIVKAGTAYTVAATYCIDPETQAQLNYLYTFIAASDVTMNASGAGNITIAGKIYTTATNRTQATVSALPQSGAAITPVEAGSVASKAGKLVFGVHPDAIALACVDLDTPPSVESGQESFENLSLRIVKGYDINTDIVTCRVDIQFGWGVLRSELLTSTMGLVK